MHLVSVSCHHRGAAALVSIDARGAQRQQTMFLVGRIATPAGDRACLVRNISATGVGVEHRGDLSVDMIVAIETRTLLSTRAIVRWSAGTAAGLEFIEPPRVVAPSSGARRMLRSPRFTFECDAEVRIDGLTIPTRTNDLSLGGLKIVGIEIGDRSSPVRVLLPQIGRTFSGHIRWNTATSAGLQFVAPLRSSELASILATTDISAR